MLIQQKKITENEQPSYKMKFFTNEGCFTNPDFDKYKALRCAVELSWHNTWSRPLIPSRTK